MNFIKYFSTEEAIQKIRSGNRVFLHGSAATPVHLIKALLKRHGELKNVEFISITTLGDIKFDNPDFTKSFFFNSPLWKKLKAKSESIDQHCSSGSPGKPGKIVS